MARKHGEARAIEAVTPPEICSRVTQISRLLASAISGGLAQLGLTPGQLGTLLALYEHDGQTQAELARAVGVEQPSMALTLRRMERDGLVRRDADPHDRRRSIVTLTSAAQAVRTNVQALRGEIAADVLSGFTAQERASLQGMLGRLMTNLEQGR